MTITQNLPSTRIIIILALLAMLTLSFISFMTATRTKELSRRANHSNSIILILQETYSDLSDADSELSKYILTRDLLYQEKMVVLEHKIQGSIQKLKSLASDNADHGKRLLLLDSLIKKSFELMKQELQISDSDYTKSALAITESNQKIRSMISAFRQSENNDLVELQRAADEYSAWTPVMIFGFEVVVVVFLVSAYFKTDNELRIKRSLQKELESQVQFITAVLDNSVDLILVVDTELKLVVANKKAYDLLDLTDAMIEKNIFSIFPNAVKSRSHDAILRAFNGEHVHIENHKAHSIDRTLDSYFVPLFKKDKVYAVIMIHHDVSTLVKAYDDLAKTNEQLRNNNLELEQFAYVASHDLQEPLRKISTYASFAERASNDPEKLSGYLSRISSSAARMSNLIRDVLDFSRASVRSSADESVDLNVVYRKVIQDLELFIEERHATLNPTTLPVVAGHEHQLSQVFYNLIHNALKFCDQRPVISIHCRTENGYYIISIIDNGIGFDQRYADQIFEVFKRIPNERGYAGTGIGLAVCKKIIGNHHGKITVQSVPGQGTTFEVILPIPPLKTVSLMSESSMTLTVPSKPGK